MGGGGTPQIKCNQTLYVSDYFNKLEDEIIGVLHFIGTYKLKTKIITNRFVCRYIVYTRPLWNDTLMMYLQPTCNYLFLDTTIVMIRFNEETRLEKIKVKKVRTFTNFVSTHDLMDISLSFSFQLQQYIIMIIIS